MIENSPRTVVLLDGSIEAITCAAIVADRVEGEPRSVQVMPLAYRDLHQPVFPEARLEAIKRQIEFLGVAPPSGGIKPLFGLVGLASAISEAGMEATVVWPRRCTGDPDGIARSVAMAEQLTGLAEATRPGSSLEIELPLLDLSPSQVLELASALGAPLGASWPCDIDGPSPSPDCETYQLWMEAAVASGRPLPWNSPAATH